MTNLYARQAIETHYLCPTNHRGSRVVARCDAGRLVWDWDHSMGAVDNHAAAARALAIKLGWLDPARFSAVAPAYIGSTKRGYAVVFSASHAEVR